MLNLGKIIFETGLNPKKYSKVSEIPVIMYDRKQREITEAEFNFDKKLFSSNPNSLSRFIQLLESMSNNPPEKLCARINDEHLVLYFPSQKPEFLLL